MYLVGAGPGDPGLLTVKGRSLLEQADVILYDRLVDARLLHYARADAELIDAGKGQDRAGMSQEEINRLLVEMGRAGKRVVRLKGGDPFVFGRGGEEAEVLAAANVPFAVVPGVTSAVAVPAYAGIPLTHRAVSSSFTVVSGSEDPTKEVSSIAWDRLATGAGTLVVLMGWQSLPQVVETLKRYGRSPQSPAALIQWGTEPYQVTVTGTLDDIMAKAEEAQLSPPVVAVFGEVVGLREKLRWFEGASLFGKRILVTRTRTQASALAELLAAEGAEPVELPTLEIEPLPDSRELRAILNNLLAFQWVVFTSANGVDIFFERLRTLGRDARALGSARVCAIGSATAQRLERFGVVADLVPQEYVAEAVAGELEAIGVEGGRVLLARAEGARDVLAKRLTGAGAQVEELSLYRIQVPQESRSRAQALFGEGKIDVVTFTSSSTVRHLAELLDGDLSAVKRTVVACIGPITAATAAELGLSVQVQAREYTVPGLVQALKDYFGKGGG